MSQPKINYDLLKSLSTQDHPLLHIAEDFEQQITSIPVAWAGEIFEQARTAHHLLDMVGIPHGIAYAQDLDSRTWQAVNQIVQLKDRLARIAAWHSRETGPHGLIGDYCTECSERWPCETRRMADGSHHDLTEENP